MIVASTTGQAKWLRSPTASVVSNEHGRAGLCHTTDIRGVYSSVRASRTSPARLARRACDGIEGLDLLRAGLKPRAVFLDSRMPRLDGAGVLAAMREDPALVPIPVVWMSGDRRQPPVVAAHLEKPFDVDALVVVLGALCEAD